MGQRSFDDYVGLIFLKNDHGCDGHHNASTFFLKKTMIVILSHRQMIAGSPIFNIHD